MSSIKNCGIEYQKDLAEIFGSQANVSKFLNGERSLGKNAIAGLKKIWSKCRFFYSLDRPCLSGLWPFLTGLTQNPDLSVGFSF